MASITIIYRHSGILLRFEQSLSRLQGPRCGCRCFWPPFHCEPRSSKTLGSRSRIESISPRVVLWWHPSGLCGLAISRARNDRRGEEITSENNRISGGSHEHATPDDNVTIFWLPPKLCRLNQRQCGVRFVSGRSKPATLRNALRCGPCRRHKGVGSMVVDHTHPPAQNRRQVDPASN